MVQRNIGTRPGPEWISERRVSLEERLLAFYRDYVRLLHNYEWVRLFAFSGLDGLPHHVRFAERATAMQIFPRIAGELRHDHRPAAAWKSCR